MRSFQIGPRSALASLVAAAALALVACSSDSGSSTPTSSQTPGNLSPAPDDGSNVPNPIHTTDITIQGQGTVSTSDGASVHCVSDASGQSGACTAEHEATLYVQPADGWAFDHWDPVGGNKTVLTMSLAVGTKLTAVFVKAP